MRNNLHFVILHQLNNAGTVANSSFAKADEVLGFEEQVEVLEMEVEQLKAHMGNLERFSDSDEEITFFTEFLSLAMVKACWEIIDPRKGNMMHYTAEC